MFFTFGHENGDGGVRFQQHAPIDFTKRVLCLERARSLVDSITKSRWRLQTKYPIVPPHMCLENTRERRNEQGEKKRKKKRLSYRRCDKNLLTLTISRGRPRRDCCYCVARFFFFFSSPYLIIVRSIRTANVEIGFCRKICNTLNFFVIKK